jgi:hypothetical protein
MTGAAEHQAPGAPSPEPLLCSFCAKAHTEVDFLLAAPSPGVFICGECIELCAETLAEERGRRSPPDPPVTNP